MSFSFARNSRPSFKRTISSRSLKKQVGSTNINLDDGFSIGGKDFSIEYRRVPWNLWIFGLFHSFIEFRFFPLLFIILSIIILIVFLFAEIYLSISPNCGLELNSLGDAWLFSVLIHFRTVFTPANPDNIFWNGCTEGIVSLYAQLFIGNILMSILLSTLLFNFQSISRRSNSLFNTITIGQRLYAGVNEENQEPFISFPVVELNETDSRKVTGVSVQVFLFDPAAINSGKPVQTLASNIFLNTIETPQNVIVPLLPVPDSNPDCSVCGKSFRSKSSLIKHCRTQQDNQHIASYLALLALEKDRENRTQNDLLKQLWSQDLEFIVIVEASDPVTTDRVQVQRIFKSASIVPTQAQDVAYISPSATIDYKHFL